MVPRRDGAERRARPREVRLHADAAADRAVAQAVRGAQPAPQERALPLGDVDAHVLREPRGTEPSGEPAPRDSAGQGRAAQALRALNIGARSVRGDPSGARAARTVLRAEEHIEVLALTEERT